MVTRRRVLTILAGVAALPVVGARAATTIQNWRGLALGADARIILDHPDAQRLIGGAVEEIRRLEGIFSLYRVDSQLSVLNRQAVLHAPAFEMVELLSTCAVLNERTAGAFDPSVQTLWSLYANSHSRGAAPSAAQISQALEKTGWHHVQFSPAKVVFKRAGVQLTLNGVAQGFIADKIADYFRANGVQNVLVDTGEIAAVGFAPDGGPWKIGFNNAAMATLPLSNGAIATSAPLGTVFDAVAQAGHILDPRPGIPGAQWAEVTVISSSGAEADGLSTAFSLMSRPAIELAKGSAQVFLSPA
ncbi:MAG: FAD:protein FMN transferase [Devosiaceae bacterium]|nr:FAD:protein FMN transferase [Devosiaceae bacterium]